VELKSDWWSQTGWSQTGGTKVRLGEKQAKLDGKKVRLGRKKARLGENKVRLVWSLYGNPGTCYGAAHVTWSRGISVLRVRPRFDHVGVVSAVFSKLYFFRTFAVSQFRPTLCISDGLVISLHSHNHNRKQSPLS
jgi:hypothetical protein